MGLIRKVMRKIRGDEEKQNNEEVEAAMNRNLSASFIEHTLERQQLAELYKDTGIDIDSPNRSRGLTEG